MRQKPLNELDRMVLIFLLSVITFGYFASVYILGQERAIEGGNIIRLSLWSGAAIACLPGALSAIRQPKPDGAAIVALGIFLGGVGVVYQTFGAVLWRVFGKPPEWIDSWLWGLHIVFFCSAGLCILIGLEATNGKVPPKLWLRVGSLVAVSMMIFGLAAIAQTN